MFGSLQKVRLAVNTIRTKLLRKEEVSLSLINELDFI